MQNRYNTILFCSSIMIVGSSLYLFNKIDRTQEKVTYENLIENLIEKIKIQKKV